MRAAADFGQGFHNRAHIADRHRVIEQTLQSAGQHTQRQLGGHQVFHQLGRLGGQLVQQLLHFVVAEQIGCVIAQYFIQMGGHGSSRIDYGIAQGPGMVALRRLNPHRVQAEGRFGGGRALQIAVHLAGIDRHFATDFDFAAPAHHTFEHDVVAVRVDAQSIADTHRLDQKAQFGRQFFAYTFHACHQLAARLGIDQRYQSVTDFQAYQVHLVQVFPIKFLGLLSGGHGGGLGHFFGGVGGGLAAQQYPAQTGGSSGQKDKHQVRHAGHYTEHRHDDGGDK